MSKKIIYVITSLDYGGTQKQLYYVVKMLKCTNLNLQQLEPVVVSLKRSGKYREKFVSLGIKIFDLGMDEKFNLFTAIFLLKYFLKFILMVLKEKPVIIHSFLFQANVFTMFVKIFFPNCKTILSERVAEKEKWFNIKILQLFYKLNFLYDKLLVNSEDLKKFVVDKYGVKKEKIILIPNMIDLQNNKTNIVAKEKIREELYLSKGDVMILSVGRLHKQKGYDLLIEVAKEVRNKKEEILNINKEIFFIIIGDGEERNKLEKQVNEYNLSNIVKFVGYKENVYSYISSCDIFLLTSFWEGSPNVILEAISCNKPVISTEVEGVTEIIQGLPDCFVIPIVKDRRQLTEKIVDKILLLASRIDKINNDYSKIIEKYSVKNVSTQFLNLYTLV